MIFRYFVLVLIFSTVFLSGILQNTYAVSVVAVTDNGSSFPVELSTSDTSSDGTSVFDALGVYMVIQNINTDGIVYFGDGDSPGKQTDIRGYVGIDSSDDWAIAITDDDFYETLYVSEFGKQYTYVSGSLVDVSESEPNTLGFSKSRSMSGSNSISLNNDGITVSGTGIHVADITMMQGTSVLLTGDIDTGANLEIIQTPQDMMNVISYSTTNGYLMYEIDAALSGTTAYANTDIEIHEDDELIVYTWETWIEAHSKLYQCGRGKCYLTTYHEHVDNIGSPTIIGTIDGDDTRLITKIEHIGISADNSYEFKFYVSDFGEKLQSFDSDFETLYEFETTAKNTYLIAEIDDNSVLIKGESFDADSNVYLEIDGLSSDIAYDISKNGITGVVEKTSSTGTISLLYEDVDFGISTSLGGILKLYPDSILYQDDFGIGMIDLYIMDSQLYYQQVQMIYYSSHKIISGGSFLLP